MDARVSEQSIFLNAIRLGSPTERAAYLDEACVDAPSQRADIEALLAAHDLLGGAPAEPADADRDSTLGRIAGVATGSSGAVIGPYKLLEVIGEGGMGTVCMAEQVEPIRRRVAIKVIKVGMDSRQVLARFAAERQALALMDHPNIAKVLDAGSTPEGRPFFVMELVKGVPITRYCDELRLDVRGRLGLFAAVCAAVQHAHQKGIIHRDLKPSNVLVAPFDDEAVVKVIDFGVAKATGQSLSERTLFTGFGAVVGTLEYMSPEQAQLNHRDIDTRSDVYALGVLLYELLTGTTPIPSQGLKDAALLEVLRLVREEDPPRPSTRLSTTGELPSIAANRGVEPRRLSGLIRGELDWIVMKALEKDRSRRYETASGFAADIRRYLADEAVEACPPSAWYRLRKLGRRNRAALATVSTVLAALLLGTAVTATQAVRATRSERLARENSRRARAAVDDVYTQVADKLLARQPKMEPLQREFLQKALVHYEQFAREAGPEPSVRLGTARAFRRVGEIHHKLNDPIAAERAFRQAIDRLRALVDEFPDVAEYRQDLAQALHSLGLVFEETRRDAEQAQTQHRALELQKRLVAEFPAVPEYRRDLARSHRLAHDCPSAIEIERRLVAEFPDVPEYRHDLAVSYTQYNRDLFGKNRIEERRQALLAAASLLEGLVAESPSVPEYRNDLGDAWFWLSTTLPPKQGEPLLKRTLALQEELVADFPMVAYYRYDLMRTLGKLSKLAGQAGRAAEVEQTIRRAVAIGEGLVAEAPLTYQAGLGGVYATLADHMRKAGRLAEAEAAYRRAMVLWRETVAGGRERLGDAQRLGQAGINLATLLADAGRFDEAKSAYRAGLVVLPTDAGWLNGTARILVTHADPRFHDPVLAVELARKATDLRPQQGNHWNTLGVAAYRVGDFTAAVGALQKSMDLRKGGDPSEWLILAMVHERLGEPVEARRWYDRDVAWKRNHGEGNAELRRFRAEAEKLLSKADPPSGGAVPGVLPAKEP